MVSDRLKDIIFKKLYKELSKVEIIPYKESVYFIDRDNKYWYFEYEKSNKLWWRYDFFINFFVLFSLGPDDYEKVMGEWVEEVLNCKVDTTLPPLLIPKMKVEEVLNCKVTTTHTSSNWEPQLVEEVLNCKVTTTDWIEDEGIRTVEEILNCKVITTSGSMAQPPKLVDDILNHKVDVTMARITDRSTEVEEVLNSDTVL